MSDALFTAVPVLSIAAGGALLAVGFGALDPLWNPRRSPADELLARLRATPVADRRGLLTPEQEARLAAPIAADSTAWEAELASASGVYRVDLWRARARRLGERGGWAEAAAVLRQAVAEMPTDPGVQAELAAACWQAGDRPGFVAATRAWAGLAGLPRDEAARVQGWLRTL